jgi:hypothetical protein
MIHNLNGINFPSSICTNKHLGGVTVEEYGGQDLIRSYQANCALNKQMGSDTVLLKSHALAYMQVGRFLKGNRDDPALHMVRLHNHYIILAQMLTPKI